MNYFTADFHLNEISAPHTHSFLRPFQPNPNENLLDKLYRLKDLNEDDILYHLGDVAVDIEGWKYCVEYMKNIPCKKVLILGDKETNNKNCTWEEIEPYAQQCFDEIYQKKVILTLFGQALLIHKPVDGVLDDCGLPIICGHIHGSARVQKFAVPQRDINRPIINVGIDAWCYQIVSEERLEHQYNALTKGYYDDNVFINQVKL